MTAGARGGGMTLVGQGLKVLILMASVVTLSRMLPPEDFGLVAMVSVIVALGELLRDLGLSTAALRAPELSHQQASNLFWVNTGLGGLGAILMAVAAPVMVLIYGEPALQILTPVLAISLFLNGAQAQYQVQLARSHRFFWLNATDVFAQLAALILAIIAAALGWGYWALVVQALANALILLITRVFAARWRPLRPKRDGETLPLLKAGVDYSATQVLTFAANNVDTVMIGSVWGAGGLGLYNRAFQLQSLPVARLMSPLVNVVVPVMNSARAAGEDVSAHFRKVQSAVGIVAVSIFALAISVADPLIPLVLGENWATSIALFQILAIGGAIQGFSQVSFWIFLVQGTSRELLKYNVVTKLMTIVLVVCGALVSLELAAAALSLSLAISWPINLLWLRATAGVPARPLLINGARILFCGAVSAVVTLLLPLGEWVSNDIALLLLKFVVACALLVLTVLVSPAGRRDLRWMFAAGKRIVTKS